MSASIGSATSSSSAYTAVNLNRNKQNPGKLADELFSKLDSNNQGYISAVDLESAFSTTNATNASGSTTDSKSTADALFAKLDSDGDGKVTESEFSSGIQKLAEQLHSQFDNQRVHGGGHGGHAHGAGGPPPASDSSTDSDSGLTQDQLTALANDSDTNTAAASLFSTLASNFTAADANGDGKITRDEAFAYKASVNGISASSENTSAASGLNTVAATGSSSDTNSSTDTASSEAQFMAQLMKLAHAYGIFGSDSSTAPSTHQTGSISATA